MALTALLSAMPIVCAHAEGVQAPAVHNGSPSDSNLRFVGRWDKSNSATYKSHWGGAYVRASFTGTSVALKGGSAAGGPTVMVSLDGEPLRETGEFRVQGLKPGSHTLLLGSPSQNSEVDFQGLTLDAGATTLPVEAKPIIEFVGDSITTGGGQTRPGTVNYAWQSAEMLGADHTQIAFSGRALTTGYGCAEDKAALDTRYFQLKNFNHLKDDPQVAWKVDYQPQIVVINLGQNDQCGAEPAATFQASYESFIKKIRAKLPKAHIVALRPFGGPYEKSVRAAVEATNAAGDKKVTFVDTTGWLQATDYVDGTHPTEAGHDKVAAKLVGVLKPLLTPGARQITIAPGKYIMPGGNDRATLTFRDMNDLTVDARKVEFSMLDEKDAIGVYNCQNLTIRGATTHYQRPRFGQAKITGFGRDAAKGPYYDVQIDRGYSFNSNFGSAYIFDAATRKIRFRTYDMSAKSVEKLDAQGKTRVFWQSNDLLPPKYNVAVGDYLVCRGDGNSLLHVDTSKNCTFEKLNFYWGGAFGVFETGRNVANNYLGVALRTGPVPPGGTNAPFISQSADGFHSSGAVVGPHIENSFFERMCDDGIAIHGSYDTISSVNGAKLTIGDRTSFQMGDTARVNGSDGFQEDARVTDVARNAANNFVLTLDRALNALVGYKAGNVSASGAGYKLIGNTILNNRARGILVKGDNGLIENNLIDGSTMSGISIGPEYYWGEAGYCVNVTVRGNTIRNVNYASNNFGRNGAILLHGEGAKGNRNISIQDNVFSGVLGPNLILEWGDGVQVINNRFVNTHARSVGADDFVKTVVWVAHSNNLKLSGNTLSNPGPEFRTLRLVGDDVTNLMGADDGLTRQRRR